MLGILFRQGHQHVVNNPSTKLVVEITTMNVNSPIVIGSGWSIVDRNSNTRWFTRDCFESLHINKYLLGTNLDYGSSRSSISSSPNPPRESALKPLRSSNSAGLS
eukprot:m.80196 g.80196  ORF g.80196 m.80196 type:complete len:105 (+) comp10883_c0_seq1:1761-2075(+)